MVRLTIDGTAIETVSGATLLEAAQQAGAEVPTLCYEKEAGAINSCMLCVVMDRASRRMLPACSAKAADGMDIDTQGDEVRAARREILKMLLSEHVGDCEAPCSRICPAALNIPRMLRHIADGDMMAAARIAKRDLIFPATLGWICSAPCQRGCRRSLYDTAVGIRGSHRDIFDGTHGTYGTRKTYDGSVVSGKRIAIIGAGLAGLAAAWVCSEYGHSCRVYEKRASACPALYALPPGRLPRDVLDAEVQSVHDVGVEFVFEREIGTGVALGNLTAEFDAVILACDFTALSSEQVVTAREDSMPVRAVARGKAAAQRVNAMLRGIPVNENAKRFNSQIGSLRGEEMTAYATERLQKIRGESLEGQAARCLHCDCLKPVSCKLRRYAVEYGLAWPVKRHMPRSAIEAIQRTGDVLFEPGKCIKCGICVAITRSSGARLGLTFAGRGLASRVDVPFAEPLANAFPSREVAMRCVRACPTGALALCSEEETV